MTGITTDELTQRALDVGILTQSQLQEVYRACGAIDVEPTLFLQELQRQGFLTNYQIDRLLSREPTGFFYGDYRILYRIGAGSFARVFRATHRTTGKFVALKVLRGRFNDNPMIINHFLHEAEMGTNLRHPNIVPVFEVKSENNAHYMVMDFIEGQTLRDFVKTRKKVDVKVATRIITDVCSGLDYAAKRGVLHRDLKLSNVLLSSMGKAMLVDFGLATIIENEAGFSGQKNQRSIDYAVLEKMTGVRRDDPRSDIFFLGCMYYHLLTGEAPLPETKDRIKRSDKNRFHTIKPLLNQDATIPWAVSTIVQKAMSLDVNQRYQTMGDMFLELESCARRLVDGTANQEGPVVMNETGKSPSTTIPPEPQQCLMIVESNPELQTVFRESLKKAGYRVLLASSAERAVDRLLDDSNVADLVIFNAQYLGRAALDGYNRLAVDGYGKNIPLLLLVEERQLELLSDITRDDRHHVLVLPLSVKQLKEAIAKLLSKNPRESGRTDKVPQFIELPFFIDEAEETSKTFEEEIDDDLDIQERDEFQPLGYKDILNERTDEEEERNRQAEDLFDNAVARFQVKNRQKKPVEPDVSLITLGETATLEELRTGLNAAQKQLNLIQEFLEKLSNRLDNQHYE